jgi:hypothetical protein
MNSITLVTKKLRIIVSNNPLSVIIIERLTSTFEYSNIYSIIIVIADNGSPNNRNGTNATCESVLLHDSTDAIRLSSLLLDIFFSVSNDAKHVDTQDTPGMNENIPNKAPLTLGKNRDFDRPFIRGFKKFDFESSELYVEPPVFVNWNKLSDIPNTHIDRTIIDIPLEIIISPVYAPYTSTRLARPPTENTKKLLRTDLQLSEDPIIITDDINAMYNIISTSGSHSPINEPII